MAETLRDKHLAAIAKEIDSLRTWLDYLQRDVTAIPKDGGVISAVVVASIGESCTKITYGAGIVNGSMSPLDHQGE